MGSCGHLDGAAEGATARELELDGGGVGVAVGVGQRRDYGRSVQLGDVTLVLGWVGRRPDIDLAAGQLDPAAAGGLAGQHDGQPARLGAAELAGDDDRDQPVAVGAGLALGALEARR